MLVKPRHLQEEQPSVCCIPRGTPTTYDASKDFVFQAWTWNVVDEGELDTPKKETRRAKVYITGTTETELSVSLRVDVKPWFMVKMLDSQGRSVLWTPEQIEHFIHDMLLEKRTIPTGNEPGYVETFMDPHSGRPAGYLCQEEEDNLEFPSYARHYNQYDFNGLLRVHTQRVQTYNSVPGTQCKHRSSYRSAFSHYEVVHMHDLDAGFTGPEPKWFPYLKLYWHTNRAKKSAIYHCENMKEEACIKLYEGALESHIRLMHETKCESTGWVSVKGGAYTFVTDPTLRNTRTCIEMNVLPTDHVAHVISPVSRLTDVGLRQCSFDLEVYSGTPGKFPNPELDSDCIFQISNYVKDFGTNVTYTRLFHVKPIDPLLLDDPEIIAIECDDERDLLLKWVSFVARSEIDLLHAWNGFDFDCRYLIVRAKKLDIWDVFECILTRINSLPARVFEKELKSNAYGANKWTILQMPGRVMFDPMVHIKREFRRENNSLNAVAADYLSFKLPNDPLACEKGSDIVTVTHANHPFNVGDVVHLIDVSLPSLTYYKDGKSDYTLGGYSFDDWYEELHDIVSVVDQNTYKIRMPRPATNTVTGGGSNVKAFESKHDVTAQQMFDAYAAGHTAMLRKVGLYCIQDTRLPQRIIDKLAILPFLLAVSRVCWVPLTYLITHGQQIKFHSQISKAAAEAHYAVHMVIRTYERNEQNVYETLQKERKEDDTLKESYVGGAVLDPVIGFHVDPIAVPDYKSLYPSRMWDGNYCFTTLVKDDRYNHLPNVAYHSVEIKDGPNGEFDRTHTFAQCFRGIVPLVVGKLLDTRSATKKEMKKYPDGSIEHTNLDAKQLALKISANSIYGATGAVSAGKLPCKAIAESTTKTGRDATFFARDYVCNVNHFRNVMACTTHFPPNYVYWVCIPKYNADQSVNRKGSTYFPMSAKALMSKGVQKLSGWQIWGTKGWTRVTGFDQDNEGKICVHMKEGTTVDMKHYRCCTFDPEEDQVVDRVVYGDSVTSDTPCLLQKIGSMDVVLKTIDDIIVDDTQWEDRDDGKQVCTHVPYMVWTEDGWSPVRRIIRHATTKPIQRVLTHTGVVDCTTDHGLVTKDGIRVSSKDVSIGDELLHCFMDTFHENTKINNTTITVEEAKAWGLFFADGSCGALEQRFRCLFYTKDKLKQIPSCILNAPKHIRKAFWEGYYEGDGDKEYTRCDIKGKIGAMGMYYLIRSIGYHVSINTRRDKPDIYRLTVTQQKQRKKPFAIKKIEDITHVYAGQFVYDLETENHHFHAGVGQMIVHNTDSIFTKFDTSHLETMEQKMIYSMCVAAYVSDEITQRLREMNPHWPKDEQRMELEYEKTFGRFILFSKKRYTGKKVEFNPYAFKTITMGVSDKRRDFCLYVKEIYRRILDVLYDMRKEWSREALVKRALEVLKTAIEDVLNNRVPFNKLKISKLLNDEYAMREQKEKKRKRCKTQKYTFGPHNLFVGDYVELKDDVVCQVESMSAQFVQHPLTCVDESGTSFPVSFSEIKRKFKGKIKLRKIMDPNTPESEIACITHPHARLARKMYARDPGTAPKSGDRVPFVFCDTGVKDELQWKKVEDPTYARQNNLKVDSAYYLKAQMQKGWAQIINTVEPGSADRLFEEAYFLYDKYRNGEQNIDHMLQGKKRDREIRLGQHMGAPRVKKKVKRTNKASETPVRTLKSWFKPTKQ